MNHVLRADLLGGRSSDMQSVARELGLFPIVRNTDGSYPCIERWHMARRRSDGAGEIDGCPGAWGSPYLGGGDCSRMRGKSAFVVGSCLLQLCIFVPKLRKSSPCRCERVV